MAVFDDIRDILQQINAKLDSQKQEPPKIPQTQKDLGKFGNFGDFSSLKGVSKILNDLGGSFSKIIPSISGIEKAFSSLWKTLSALGGLKAFFDGFKSSLNAAKNAYNSLRSKSGTGTKTGFFGRTATKSEKASVAKAIKMTGGGSEFGSSLMQEQFLASVDFATGADFMKNIKQMLPVAFKQGKANTLAAGTGGKSELGQKIAGYLGGTNQSIKAFVGVTGQAISRMASRIGPAVAGMGAQGLGMIGSGLAMAMTAKMLAVPGIIVGVGAAMVGFSRGLAAFNAQYAIAFSISDLRGQLRSMASAMRTSLTTTKFLNQWDNFADKMQPVLDAVYNVFVGFSTKILEFTNRKLTILGKMIANEEYEDRKKNPEKYTKKQLEQDEPWSIWTTLRGYNAPKEKEPDPLKQSDNKDNKFGKTVDKLDKTLDKWQETIKLSMEAVQKSADELRKQGYNPMTIGDFLKVGAESDSLTVKSIDTNRLLDSHNNNK